MNEKVLLRQKEYDELKKKLEYLKTTRREEIAQQLKEARSYGDLSENAEYDAAKEAQRNLQDEIDKTEYKVNNAEIIDESELTGEHVNLGLTVDIRDVKTGEEFSYMIVGITDADPFEGRISNESPVGKGLLGHSVGEKVDIELDGGEILTYEIIEIRKVQ